MGSIKKELGIAVLVAGLVAVAITFVSVVSSNASKKVEIRLAHNQTAGSEIADSIAKFGRFCVRGSFTESGRENLCHRCKKYLLKAGCCLRRP